MLALAIAVTCASSCGPRDDAFQPSNFRVHGAIAPPEVAVPASLDNAPSEFDGLYLEGSDAFSCCWIAPKATLFVRKRGPAVALIAGFRIPDVPRFRNGQEISIRLPGAGALANTRLFGGQQRTVRFALPADFQRKTGLVPIEITTSLDYVPSRDTPPRQTLLSFLHLRPAVVNSDTRSLGVVLLYLYFA